MQDQLGLVGYTLNGVFFSVLALLLITTWRGRLLSGLLTAATALTAVWSFLLAWLSDGDAVWARDFPLVYLIELIRSGAWLLFAAVLLRDSRRKESHSFLHRNAATIVSLILAVQLLIGVGSQANLIDYKNTGVLVICLLLTGSLGLLIMEQIYRNAYQSAKAVLKYLFVGIGVMLAYDLFLYSSSVIQSELNPLFWGLRGYVFLVCAPLIAIGAKRMPDWSTNIFVSRQVVFYSATLIGFGVYLVLLAAVGQLLRIAGGSWGDTAQVAFLIVGSLLIAYLVLSDYRRAQFRVFIDKHFFQNKYDYRHEWLQLTRILTSHEEGVSLRERCISALGKIVGSSCGAMWIVQDDGTEYVPCSAWEADVPDVVFPTGCSLLSFLAEKQWVIDIGEYELNRAHYGSLEIDASTFSILNAGYVIPLFHQSQLLGFVVLGESSTHGNLNYEDHDLLKTSGDQISSYLSQELLTEELARGRQFEAFNKLTAFLMHDLKNVLAQQTLILENAPKHRDNPAFMDDVLSTIDNSVIRIRKVLDQLTQRRQDVTPARVDVHKSLLEAVSASADRTPTPRVIEVENARVLLDKDKFQMVLLHLIRNAQDATSAAGQITLSAQVTEDRCLIIIADTGVGMDEAFVRGRLFRPFDSTKGVQGMGIGAYQAREFIQISGGSLEVSSKLGDGTSIEISLPLDSDRPTDS